LDAGLMVELLVIIETGRLAGVGLARIVSHLLF
jgi:hypothetical protein